MKHTLPCGHDAVELTEIAQTGLNYWRYKPDGPWQDASTESFPTGEYTVRCLECRKEWRFGKRQRKLPRWFLNLRDEAFAVK
jgi:hypothetical protein